MAELDSGARARIGNHRRALRAQAGLRSQKALAERAGVGVDTVTNAELGRPLKEATLRALAGALGVGVGDYAGAPSDVLPLAAGASR